MNENSDFTWKDASFSPIPRAYYHYKEKHIYKEKRAKNKKGIIPLVGMRLSKGRLIFIVSRTVVP